MKLFFTPLGDDISIAIRRGVLQINEDQYMSILFMPDDSINVILILLIEKRGSSLVESPVLE